MLVIFLSEFLEASSDVLFTNTLMVVIFGD
jgi:hypothetical protein